MTIIPVTHDDVERVAKAIFKARHRVGDWEQVTDTQYDLFRIEARAAIAAMPTIGWEPLFREMTDLVERLRAFAYQLSRCSKITMGEGDCAEVSKDLYAAVTALQHKEEAEREIERLRNILNEDGLYDPELAKMAGKSMSVLEASASKNKRKLKPEQSQ